MAAPFVHYQWLVTAASKIGGPIPFLGVVTGIGAVAGVAGSAIVIVPKVAPKVAEVLQPAVDGVRDRLFAHDVAVADGNGAVVSMTSEEIVDKALAQRSDAESEDSGREESAD